MLIYIIDIHFDIWAKKHVELVEIEKQIEKKSGGSGGEDGREREIGCVEEGWCCAGKWVGGGVGEGCWELGVGISNDWKEVLIKGWIKCLIIGLVTAPTIIQSNLISCHRTIITRCSTRS